MPDPKDLYVMVPYKQLDELLRAVEETPKMRQETQKYQREVVALKGLYGQLLERVNELMRML